MLKPNPPLQYLPHGEMLRLALSSFEMPVDLNDAKGMKNLRFTPKGDRFDGVGTSLHQLLANPKQARLDMKGVWSLFDRLTIANRNRLPYQNPREIELTDETITMPPHYAPGGYALPSEWVVQGLPCYTPVDARVNEAPLLASDVFAAKKVDKDAQCLLNLDRIKRFQMDADYLSVVFNQQRENIHFKKYFGYGVYETVFKKYPARPDEPRREITLRIRNEDQHELYAKHNSATVRLHGSAQLLLGLPNFTFDLNEHSQRDAMDLAVRLYLRLHGEMFGSEVAVEIIPYQEQDEFSYALSRRHIEVEHAPSFSVVHKSDAEEHKLNPALRVSFHRCFVGGTRFEWQMVVSHSIFSDESGALSTASVPESFNRLWIAS